MRPLAGRGGQRRWAVHGRRPGPRARGATPDADPLVVRLRGCARGGGRAGMTGTPTVAIIGRPNVGKSTLFNRLIGRRDPIVAARPGVTRDPHFAPPEWHGRPSCLSAPSGLDP